MFKEGQENMENGRVARQPPEPKPTTCVRDLLNKDRRLSVNERGYPEN